MDIQRDGDMFQFRPAPGEAAVIERALDARAQGLAEGRHLDELKALGMLVVHYEGSHQLSGEEAGGLAVVLDAYSMRTAYAIEETASKVAPRCRAAWGAIAAEVARQINDAVGDKEKQSTDRE